MPSAVSGAKYDFASKCVSAYNKQKDMRCEVFAAVRFY